MVTKRQTYTSCQTDGPVPAQTGNSAKASDKPEVAADGAKDGRRHDGGGESDPQRKDTRLGAGNMLTWASRCHRRYTSVGVAVCVVFLCVCVCMRFLSRPLNLFLAQGFCRTVLLMCCHVLLVVCIYWGWAHWERGVERPSSQIFHEGERIILFFFLHFLLKRSKHLFWKTPILWTNI